MILSFPSASPKILSKCDIASLSISIPVTLEPLLSNDKVREPGPGPISRTSDSELSGKPSSLQISIEREITS